jgi:hypothetical protein
MNADYRPLDQGSVGRDPTVRNTAGKRQARQAIRDATLGHRLDLDLSSLQLASLSPELAQLTNLQTLKLSANLLTVLPAWFGQLTNLQRLELGGNRLTEAPRVRWRPGYQADGRRL